MEALCLIGFTACAQFGKSSITLIELVEPVTTEEHLRHTFGLVWARCQGPA